MDDGDGFFGFNTSLPTVSRGPQQELGDVELEDYDTFNDETFGTDALADDWEEQHERLAEALVEGETPETDDNIDVAFSMSKLILDDDDLDISSVRASQASKSTPIASRLFGRSSPPPYLLEADVVGSPSTQSIWSAFASTRKADEQPVQTSPAILPQKIKTVEDLERELFKPKTSTPMTVADLERSIRAGGGKIHSVEEIEAAVTRSAQAKPNTPLIPPPVGPLPPPLIGLAPPGVLRGMVPPMALVGAQLPPHLLRMPGPPPMGLPFMHEGMPRPGMPPLPPGFLPPTRPPGMMQQPNGALRQNYQKDTHTGDEDYDDYAGLMSFREKQWLLSIQMHQLVSDNPYVDDYYYTVQRLRRLGALKSGPAGQKLILPDRPKPDAKPYSPTQFANSLGKLQVVTFTAPRRIIDVDKAPSSEIHPEGSQTNVRDMRKFKKILLDIENMLYWVLQLEDVGKRFEDSTGENPPENTDVQQKLEAALSSTERIFQIINVRKGKVLVMRALRLLSPRFFELVLSTVLNNWALLLRKDAKEHILFGLLIPFSDYLHKLENLEALVTLASPLKDKNGTFNECLTYQMGLAVVCLLLNRSVDLYPSADPSVQQRWAQVCGSLADSLLQLPESFKPYAEVPLFSLTAFQQTAALDAENITRLERVLERLSQGSSN